MWDKFSRNREMLEIDSTAEGMELVRQCARPAEGQSIGGQILQASRVLGWPFNRTKKIWYGEAVIKVAEMDLLRARVRELERKAAHREGLLNETRQRVERTFPHQYSGDRGEIFDMGDRESPSDV